VDREVLKLASNYQTRLSKAYNTASDSDAVIVAVYD
jgi:hypothetical protein